MSAHLQGVNSELHIKRPVWKALETHYKRIRDLHLRDLFANDPTRGERMVAHGAGIYLDYSKNRITDHTLKLLTQLAEESGLQARIDAMFRGAKINNTEKRAVLHVALRAPRGASIFVDSENVVPRVHAVLDKMSHFCARVRSGEWKGHTGKPVRNVINIGIGGSDLGPVMAYEALKYYSDRSINFGSFPTLTAPTLWKRFAIWMPSETLFIVSSKTFTTLETMTNARAARAWLVGVWVATRSRFPSTLSQSQPMRQEVAKFGIDTATCSSSGTGSAAATPWPRRLAFPQCLRLVRRISAPCWMVSARWTHTSWPLLSSATCRC